MSFVDTMATGLVPLYAHFGEAATWAGVAGVTVIREEGARDLAMGRGHGRLAAVVLFVRAAEVAAPEPGDVVQITGGPMAGKAYQLLDGSEPELDDLGLEWTCEAERLP